MKWRSHGNDIFFHYNHPNIKVIRTSRGKACFLVGEGLSLFILREEGVFPDGKVIEGFPLDGKIVVFRIRTGALVPKAPLPHITSSWQCTSSILAHLMVLFFFFFGSMFSSVELCSIPLSLYSKQAFFLIILIGNFLFIMKGF